MRHGELGLHQSISTINRCGRRYQSFSSPRFGILAYVSCPADAKARNRLVPNALRFATRQSMPQDSDYAHINTYVVDAEGEPQVEPDFDRWQAWMQWNDQPLAETHVARGVWVTTRFMGFDQRGIKIGAPLLWETMIFGGPHDLHQQRYTSEADALKSHERAVAPA